MTAVRAVPDHAPQPQDHKPKKSVAARRAEADGFAEVEVCGISLRIPAGKNVPVKSMLRFQGLNDDLTPIDGEGKAQMMGIRELLGPDQWASLLEQNPTGADFDTIGNALEDLQGN